MTKRFSSVVGFIWLAVMLTAAAPGDAPLGERLVSRDGKIRGVALGELDQLDADAKASLVPSLVRAMKDKNWHVRIDAIAALGRIGPVADAAYPAIVEALNDDDQRDALKEKRDQPGRPEVFCGCEV